MHKMVPKRNCHTTWKKVRQIIVKKGQKGPISLVKLASEEHFNSLLKKSCKIEKEREPKELSLIIFDFEGMHPPGFKAKCKIARRGQENLRRLGATFCNSRRSFAKECPSLMQFLDK